MDTSVINCTSKIVQTMSPEFGGFKCYWRKELKGIDKI